MLKGKDLIKLGFEPGPAVGAALKLLAQADVKERLAKMGFEGVGDTPQHFAAFVQAEIAKWANVVKDANIKVE